ncbi:hypothetical protein PsorP6_006544 [Peronosclerospora sorghi]|uniref:Uncharacterized protein n=1 Tax=Peronosclerospora sorghi TaxID=230839 RepID=A0ACC0W4I8_9STRA|nr:hypothetical protein PsorP6_006544 [Peronosclerospora sorghi]
MLESGFEVSEDDMNGETLAASSQWLGIRPPELLPPLILIPQSASKWKDGQAFFVLVGVKGSAFSVKIDDRECVDDLKDAIKAKNDDITMRTNWICSSYAQRTVREATIYIPRSRPPRQVVKCVGPHERPNQLYVPKTSSYAAIDAWMPTFGGFQMTVEKKQGIKPGAADDLKKVGESGDRLYFLLSPRYYEYFHQEETSKHPTVCNPYPVS